MSQVTHTRQTEIYKRSGVTSVMIVLLCSLLTACALFPMKATGTTSGQGTTSGNGAPGLPMSMNTIATATASGIQVRANIYCGPWVVLAPHSASYSQSELAAISQFVSQHQSDIIGATENFSTYASDGSVTLPSTLRFVPGYHTCTGTYEVTNTGSSLVQINGAGFQPSAPPTAYSYDYHLIDACPYLQSCGCDGCGAAFGCAYSVDIQMTMSQSAAMQDFAPNSDSNCPTPINLQPGATIPIVVDFEKPTGHLSVWYHGVPALSVTTSSGTSTLTYPTLLDNLVFANLGDHAKDAQAAAAGQYAPAPQDTNIHVECYIQHGSGFEPLSTFNTLLDADTPANTFPQPSLCF